MTGTGTLDLSAVLSTILRGAHMSVLLVFRQRLIAVVDDRLVAIGFFHRAFEIIGDKQLRHAAEEG